MSCGRGIDFGSRLKLSQKPDPNMDPFYSKADQDTDPGPKPRCGSESETLLADPDQIKCPGIHYSVSKSVE